MTAQKKKEQMQKLHEEYLDINVEIAEHEIVIKQYEGSIKSRELDILVLRRRQEKLMRQRTALDFTKVARKAKGKE